MREGEGLTYHDDLICPVARCDSLSFLFAVVKFNETTETSLFTIISLFFPKILFNLLSDLYFSRDDL